ncbi:fatty acyl-CoA reductase [Brachybacterium phenoliresistens]|uniref:Fatty acyl-CoA reductase n=1 Tax=Brachybacterium phenoliresistens TaxID=396014 RepID=Z9JS43_9MICO|nr:SDR family NAD(P)-dependent oxidoreductase [Brachybacterium phenoliresistens]EWS80621.1 fatty acyl-CoA reductase [Brachybacterium phenoliresistens]
MRRRGTAPAEGLTVVTGASGGIGAALVDSLARPGARLVITARRADALDRVAEQARARGAQVSVRVCDLRDEDAVARLAALILEHDGVPDTVICCAGRSLHRPLARSFARPDDLGRLSAVNLVGTAGLILALLEPMCAAGRGTVVAVTSAAARIPAPGWAAYTASKAGLDSWLRSIRPDAARCGVRIAIAEVPLVATTMSSPLYGAAPRGALSPQQGSAFVLRALRPHRTLVSPLWARIAAPIAQAAPAAGARAAGRIGRLAVRFARRDR